jgi:energy-coupling factor transport system permease protein
MNGPPEQLDARAWLAWALAGMAATLGARNPLYSLIILLAAWAVQAARALPSQHGLPLLRLALAILPLTALFNGLTSQYGNTVLLRLPASWPLIGGPITLEALIYGLSNGLALLALLALFSTLSVCVPAYRLVRLTPRAFHSLGVVLLIALSYGPQTARDLVRVREAQAVRGHRLRGVRDWRPVVLPLLIGGLERAMNLAEAMVARGYGATADRGASTPMRALLALSLLGLLGGWLLSIFRRPEGLPLLLLGGLLLTLVLWRTRCAVPTSSYRPTRWTWRDSSVALGAGLAWLATAAPLPALKAETLFYYPYPQAHLPGFDPLIGLALSLLALPALLAAPQAQPQQALRPDES